MTITINKYLTAIKASSLLNIFDESSLYVHHKNHKITSIGTVIHIMDVFTTITFIPTVLEHANPTDGLWGRTTNLIVGV